ncbi:unnamed protein product [Ceutorhynchus assimilis]|uniref:Uncharacterized protein n=1 Tax=Ceutorhynchus assimilis TaxID=467358 RepID=A0A9P0DY57_9CUCU|nr:unnamed protein product [Ceutorhynchus assimilis]
MFCGLLVGRQLTGRQSRPSTSSSGSVWSPILIDALTEPESQDENVPPNNICSPVASCSYWRNQQSRNESIRSLIPSCTYSRASDQDEEDDEILATETPRLTSFRKPRTLSEDDVVPTHENRSQTFTSTSSKKQTSPKEMEQVIKIASSLAQNLERKTIRKKSRNAIFVEYLLDILEGLPEEEAGNIRRDILKYLCDNHLDQI